MAHVLVEATPGAATSAPIYGVLGVRIPWAGPRSCRAPGVLVLDPRARLLPPGIQLGCPWVRHLGTTCRLLAPADYGKTGLGTSTQVPVNDTTGAGNPITGPGT
jgi:hypothetical protein